MTFILKEIIQVKQSYKSFKANMIKLSPLLLQNKQVKNCVKVHTAHKWPCYTGKTGTEALRAAGHDKIIAKVGPDHEWPCL